MHASTQERFKHCIPPQPTIDLFHPLFPRRAIPGLPKEDPDEMPTSNCRINITFRFYRPDFHSDKTPRCKCGVPCILRPDMKNRVDRDIQSAPGSSNTTGTHKMKGKETLNGKGDPNDYTIKYWWTCYAGAQNEGKGCGMWKVMDPKAEGRGPFIGDNTRQS